MQRAELIVLGIFFGVVLVTSLILIISSAINYGKRLQKKQMKNKRGGDI